MIRMTKIRTKSETIRQFIIEQLPEHPADIIRVTAEKFACSRQAVHKHIQKLIAEGIVKETGQTRNKTYRLAALTQWQKEYQLSESLAEDVIWRKDIEPLLDNLPKNVLDIWHYGFTEMLNNAIDHSGANQIFISVTRTAAITRIEIVDSGIGIFKKIQAALDLLDERHAVLELAKGKLTTDPANHSGEGIFFSSRMFDEFSIASGNALFSHRFGKGDNWLFGPEQHQDQSGTWVTLVLHNHSTKTAKKVFDQFTTDEDYSFDKTVVPVKLMQYGDDNLVSRSQAKRLLARLDQFKVVILDFSGVTSIGQAFADEVFRVFSNKHPEIELIATHASATVKQMISRAQTKK